ncbi:hypothetical protein GH714_028812 [Hevea brasiliensis]|uniref:NTF2 domain-containing protein n=1 Tax=Hevea brasiliensis TaxID=3981 RepID=A0A6A6NKP3_HEVBR|nr:hypothetical protein GH714_028812 [Hevea brasiliensis]
MAGQAEESTPTAQVVGNAFVEQYYNILSKSPEVVHKFYQNSSVISRPDFDGLMLSASTLEGIDKMILSLDYKNCEVEILTTDAQESFGDGVIVLVTGFFTGKDNIRRKFTQLFFLAPQDSRAYFVLNDVFRANYGFQSLCGGSYSPLEEDTVQDEETSHPSDDGKISNVDEVVSSPSVGTSQNDVPPVSSDTVHSDARSVSEAIVSEAIVSDAQENLPKKSYASVANELNYKKQPFQQRILPAKPVEQSPAIVVPEASPRPANNKPVEKNNINSVKGYSIFVANLPMSATVEQLIETFEKFGPIKPNGVQVRSYKQEKNCFGFVEFESANSMQSALEKGGFRSESFRSRGNFSGGRGYVRNEFDNQGGSSGGQFRGTARRNGEANQKVYQNGGGRVAREIQGQTQTQSLSPRGKN